MCYDLLNDILFRFQSSFVNKLMPCIWISGGSLEVYSLRCESASDLDREFSNHCCKADSINFCRVIPDSAGVY